MALYGLSNEYNLIKKNILQSSSGKTFLIAGTEMIGKRTMIESLVQDFNNIGVLDSDAPFYIKPEEDKQSIGIDNFKDLKKDSSLLISSTKMRFVIIDNAHKMTIEAQNSILKLTEELSQKIFIFLISHAPSLLLETIRSRAFLIDIKIPNNEVTSSYLETRNINMAQKKYLLDNFTGRIGLIDKIIRQPDNFKKVAQFLNSYLSVSAGERLIMNTDIAQLFTEEKEDFVLYLWTLLARQSSVNPKIIQKIQQAYNEMQYENSVTKNIMSKLAIDL